MAKKQAIGTLKLINELSQRVAIPKSVATIIVTEFIDILKDYLRNDCDIDLKKLGKLKVIRVKGYKVKHLKTKKPVDVPAYKRVMFKMSRKFFDEINNRIKL